MSPTATTVHQLKITIVGTTPPVWRRVLVPGNASLTQLHHTIQTLFDWYGDHLHEFEILGERYGIDYGGGWDDPPRDEGRAKLRELAPAGSKFLYTYDFGDNWEHRIEVEKVEVIDRSETYPRCVAGRRAAPPEDVGGVWGYEEFLSAIADPTDERHDELSEWMGGPFDPAEFDLAAVNAALAPIPT
jgi:hypothetical protein